MRALLRLQKARGLSYAELGEVTLDQLEVTLKFGDEFNGGDEDDLEEALGGGHQRGEHGPRLVPTSATRKRIAEIKRQARANAKRRQLKEV